MPPNYTVGSGAASLKLCYLDLSCVATRMEYRFKIQTSEDYLYQLEWQEVSQFEDGTLETVDKSCKFSGNGSVVTTGNFATSPPEKPGVTYAANLKVKFNHKHDPGATPGTGGVGGTSGSGFSGGPGCSSCGGDSASGAPELGVSTHSVGSGTGRPMPDTLTDARAVTMEYDPSLSGGSDGGGEIYPRFRFSLGMQLGQGEVGEVSFSRPAPNPSNYSPSILEFVPMAPGVEKILAQGLLRQVKTSLALMDVQTVNAYKFEVKFYPIAQVGAQNPTTLIYAVSGSPSVTYTIENPDASATVYNRLRISETRGASTKSYNYTYVEATKTWTLVMPDGVTSFLTERIPSSGGGPAELLTKAVYLPTGATSLQRRRRYELAANASAGFAAKLVEERLEDGATSQSVVYGYQLPPTWNTMTALVPLIGSVEHSDGRWEKFGWDQVDGRLSWHTRQVGNQPFSSGDSVNERTEFDYTVHSSTSDDAAYEKFTPRTVIEKYKNQAVRIRFATVSQFERQAVEGVLPNSGFNDVGNLRTIETFYSSGTWLNRPESMQFPDGTMTFWSYSLTGTDLTVTEKRGQPNPSKTAIDVGFEAIRVLNGAGRLKSETLKTVNAFIPTSHGLTLKSDVYGGFDSYLRPLNVVHLNGRSESQVYGCCALDSHTDQDGVTTTFGYDLNSRLVNVTRLGIQTIMALDPLGRTLVTYRKGTDNSQYPISQAQYNGLGDVVRETNALSKVTVHSETTVAGQRVHTTTYPDGATRIETYSQDGTMVSLTGTAVQPVRYVHDIGLDGGANRMYTQQIKLDETGADAWEIVTTYYDPLGRSYKTVHADGATSLSYYNGLGQLWKMVDPDGVVTLYGYDGQGQQETVVLDMDRDGVYSPSEGSQDRLTRVVRDVVTKTVGSGSKVVHRTRTYQLDDKDPDNNDPSNTAPQELLVSTSESSADGLIQWDTAHSGPTQQTRFTWTAFSTGGNRYVTNVAMDGSYSLTWLINGRLNSVVEKGTTHAQLTSKVYAYDAHGRVSTMTDARNGASVYQYNNSDQVTSSTSPLPGMGQSALTTVTVYDNMGRPATVTQPDGTAVVTEYWPSGLVKKVSGSRTYASSYTYDAQGRMTSMTTWRTEAGALNPATTTWVYSQQRGWLVRKVHPGEADTTDDYSYTPGGRLLAKVLERGLAASHAYNNGGQLQTVNFTGGVDSPWSRTLTYDRRGRLVSASHRDGMIITYSYNNLGQVTTEGYSGGILSGFKVDRDYDSLFRPWHVYARQGVTTHKTATYSYETTSSRLSRVDDGTFFADYSYLANSRLVSGVTVKTNLTTPSTVVTVSKVWDNLDRLGTISSVAQAGNTYSYGYSYNDANQRVQTRLADGSYWVYEYDRLGQVISGKRFWANGTPVPGQQYEYGFDDIGNRKTAANGGDSEGANLRSFTYAVNDANQYTSRQVPATLDVLGVARGAVTVKLDAGAAVPVSYTQGEYFRHEITARASDTVMAYPQVTVAVSGGSSQAGRIFVSVKNEVYTHDSDGNLMQDGRWTYHWDAENRLTNMVSVALPNSPPGTTPIRLEFRYDYLGRRIYKGVFTVASPNTPAKQERYVYDGWNVVLVLDGASVVQRSFLWGMDLSGSMQGAGGVGGLVAIKEHTGTVGTHVPVYDGNGNVTALVTGQGGTSTITGTYEYGPFGESIRSSGTLAKNNPFRFSTKYQDDETDLLYYGYRFYNASTGRWLSRDPIGDKGGLNYYSFVENGPNTKIDPDGRDIFVDPGPIDPLNP
ncbi:MAG: RHS repeat-associated core domain-containing protein, partial [Verrucomicrobiales bacterium]|nr:RHS repeat-associated core domain-containing protein [Verrucomicrobiales bacterium]